MSKNEFWTSASIKITSKVISTNRITELLRINPSSTFEMGSKISPRNLKSDLRSEHVWLYKSGIGSDKSLESHLENLYSLLKNKRNKVTEILDSCRIEFFCGFSSEKGQGSLILSSNILKNLASLNVDVILDLYPPE